ncbi:transglutaminase-like domain-containing protein [Clostridium thermarum]|uniref:transglutaminase-like domain-containing protein n=1 Tax=Clostridium thermarum TaxID=1716543 RepID=UPI00111D44AE|nr:transglutaminase-like domain-containing protein [Clostridium thermarum]
MKLLLGPINKNIIYITPKVLLVIGLIINMILTAKFYNITFIDPIIVLVVLLLGILIEHLYGVCLKKLYTKLAAAVLLVYFYIKVVSTWGIKSLQEYFAIIKDTNIKIFYSQEIPIYDIFPVALLLVIFIIVLVFAADRKLLGNWSIVAQFIYLTYVSYYSKGNRIFYIILIILSILYFSTNTYRRTKLQADRERLKFSVEAKKVCKNYIIASLAVFLIALGLVKVTGTKSLSELQEILRKNILKNVYTNMAKLYDISSYGFGDGDKLGGPLVANNEIMLRVKSDKAYYLRGTVKDYYTGEKWNITTSNYYIADRPDEKLLSRKVQEKLLGDALQYGFAEPKQITVYNERIKSTSLFTPYNTVLVTSDKKNIGTTRDNSFMLLEKNINHKYYNASFYESTTGFDNFEEFYNRNLKLDYGLILDNPENSTQAEYLKSLYWKCLQLPYNITDRTKELAEKIVSGGDGISDSLSIEGKIYRIMDFLRKNYTYETDVPNVPKGEEFTDYFLFELKKGYCTSFATAAVILCRLEGIPARYVEGFSMANTMDTDGLYVVRGNNAHAWCEVLVSAEYNLWAVLECTPPNYRVDSSIVVQGNKEIKMLLEKNDDKINLSKLIESEKDIGNKISALSSSFLETILKVGLVILLLLGFLLILYFSYQVIRDRKEVSRILKHNKINLLYYYIKNRLTALGIANSPNLSDQEYISRIIDKKLREYLEEIIGIYEKEYYGDRSEVNNYDKKKYLKQIEEYIRGSQNIFSYIVKKYDLDIRAYLKNNIKEN